jgi:hypothetical protein
MTPQIRRLFRPIKSRLAFGIIAVYLTFFSWSSDGSVIVTITPHTQTGMSGDILSYSATIQNDLTGTVFLNGDGINLFASGVVADDTPFLFNAPLSLGPGAMWSGEVFTLTIGATTPFLTYDGFFDIFGGPDPTALDVIGSGPFQLVVRGQGVPEPSNDLVLFSISVGILLGLHAWHGAPSRIRSLRGRS